MGFMAAEVHERKMPVRVNAVACESVGGTFPSDQVPVVVHHKK
jgi:hypothetical protein